jgi:CheY-like chemotaxis protein
VILLVDDNPDGREMYALYFLAAGYRIAEASDGATALDLVRSAQPSIIVMDLSMPGIDGWEATRRLKGNPATRAIPIIALSAHVESDARKRALEAGCDLFLMKPCLPSDLAQHVARTLDRATAAAPGPRRAPRK